MTFSIIIPVYNVKPYLSQCLNSVAQQCFPSMEVIIVDDGSTDESGFICEQYAINNPFFRVVHQENRGLAAARNTGIRLAKGDWLLFLDSDDYWEPDFLARLNTEILTHHEEPIIIGQFKVLNETTGETLLYRRPSIQYGIFSSRSYEEQIEYYGAGNIWSVWKIAIRREFLFQHQLFFFEPAIWAEDMHWIFSLFRFVTRVYYSPLIFCIYRVGRIQSLSNSNMRKHIVGCVQSFRHYQQTLADTGTPEQFRFALSHYAKVFIDEAMNCAWEPSEKRKNSACLLAKNKDLLNYINLPRCSFKERVTWLCMRVFGMKITLDLGHFFYKLMLKTR